MTVVLFVYGTLRRGYPNHARLGTVRFLGRGTIAGALFQVGPFTAIARPAPRGRRIHGEAFELIGADISERLSALDRYEGHRYRRVRVLVTLANRRRRALAYVLVGNLPPGSREIPSGIPPR